MDAAGSERRRPKGADRKSATVGVGSSPTIGLKIGKNLIENNNQIKKSEENKTKKFTLLQKINFTYLIFCGIVICISVCCPVSPPWDYSISDVIDVIDLYLSAVCCFIIIPCAFIIKLILAIRKFIHYYPIGKIVLYMILDVFLFFITLFCWYLRLASSF